MAKNQLVLLPIHFEGALCIVFDPSYFSLSLITQSIETLDPIIVITLD